MPTWIIAAALTAALAGYGLHRLHLRWLRAVWSERTRKAIEQDLRDEADGVDSSLFIRRELKRLEREGWRP